MAGIRVEGSVSGNVAEVTSTNQLEVMPGQIAVPSDVGAVRIASEVDAGTLTGTAMLRSPLVTKNNKLLIGPDTLLFNDIFNATAQNTNLWNYVLVTMTMTQLAAGSLQVGTVQGTAATHGAFLKTFQHFPLVKNTSLRAEFTFGLFTATLVANEEWRMGFASPTVAGTAPTDGIYLTLTTAGLVGSVMYNTSETSTAALATLASFTVGTYYNMSIVVHQRGVVEFWREGILLGTLAMPVGSGQPFQNGSLPIFVQKLCTGAVGNTNTCRVAHTAVYLSDVATNKDWPAQLSTSGQSGTVGQDGHTQGQTCIYANSTAPTAVALSNTAAAFTGLGGQAAVLPSLAVSTDGIIFSYQNPAATINITGRNLLIYGVWLSNHVSVSFTGGPVMYQYFLAYGHTAVSLATAETGSFVTATTHAPRRVPLGTHLFPVTTLVGTTTTNNPRLDVIFTSPLVVRPGEFVAVCAKLGVGSTVTSAGAITFMVGFDAVWE